MKLIATVLAAAALTFSAGAALAKTKSIIINGSDLGVSNGANPSAFESAEGVGLGDANSGSVVVNFTLPKDYKRNSPVKIALRMFGGGESCTVQLDPFTVVRFRNNNSKTTGLAGLTADQATTFTRPADFHMLQTRTYTLKKAGSGTLTQGTIRDQEAGDNILALFRRVGSADSCTSDSLLINTAKITYTVD